MPIIEIKLQKITNFPDCTPPFDVGIKTSNQDTQGWTVAQLNANSEAGQQWDFEEDNIPARGVCLNYVQILC